jgi:WD40 repeat protein
MVNARIDVTLASHDNLMSELQRQMDSMLSELANLQTSQEEASAWERAEALALKKKLAAAQEAARDAQRKLMDGKMQVEERAEARRRDEKAARIKEAKEARERKEQGPGGDSPPPARPPRRSNSRSGGGQGGVNGGPNAKPRGRMVGRFIEESLGGAYSASEKKSVDPTVFNAPRCAEVGKGDLEILKMREVQANAQVKYPQCRSVVYAPTNPQSEATTQKLWTANPYEKPPPAPPPETRLEMDFIYGYHNTGASQNYNSNRSNAFLLQATGELVYYTGAVVVLQDIEAPAKDSSQCFFTGHSAEVTALTLHPNGKFVASSQTGRNPPVYVWDATRRPKTSQTLDDTSHVSTLVGHTARVTSVDFSHDGKLLVSAGSDDHNTVIVWDWAKSTILTHVNGGGQTIYDMRFNPYQAYGIPDDPPLPGQAPSSDDAIYTLTSCGVRHIKFWVLLRSKDDDSDADEKRWYLEGNSVNFATKTTVQDITCFTFIDDSPELVYRDSETNELYQDEGSTDRTKSRVVAGTSDGDIFVFSQPSITLRYAANVKPKPWWLLGGVKAAEGTEHVVMKRLWDSYATITGIIPHSVESGNKYILPRKDRDEIDRLQAKLRLQSHNAEVKKKLTNIHYKGPLGHNGATTMLEYNKATNMLVSAGKDGKVKLWNPNVRPTMRESQQSTSGCLTSITSLDDSSAPLDLYDILQQGASAKSVYWSDDNPETMIIGTSTNSILELEVDTEKQSLGRVKEIVSSHFGPLSGLAMHPTKPLFVTVGRDKSVNLWQSDSFSCISQARLTAPATCVCFSNDGDTVAIGLANFEFVVLEVIDDGNFSFSLRRAFQKTVAPVKTEDSDVAVSAEVKKGRGGVPLRNGKGGDESEVTVVTRRREARGQGALKDEVMDIKYSPDGSHLAIALRDNNIYVYMVTGDDKTAEENYKLGGILKGHTSMVTNLDWSSDGVFIQSSANDAELLYWQIKPKDDTENTADFKPSQFAHPFLLRDMEWHSWTSIYGWPVQGIWPTDIDTSEPVHGVMRSNRGEVVMVCDDAARIRLMRWPSLPGDGKREYFGHAIQCMAANFSADDSTVVSIGGADCTVIQWKHVDGAGRRVNFNKNVTPRRPTQMRTPKSTRNKVGRHRATGGAAAARKEPKILEESEMEEPVNLVIDVKEEVRNKKNGGGNRKRLEVEEKKDDDAASDVRSNASRASRGSKQQARAREAEEVGVAGDGGGSRRGSKQSSRGGAALAADAFPRTVVAIHDYDATDDDEQQLRVGQQLVVVSEEGGWLTTDSGLILPAGYVE